MRVVERNALAAGLVRQAEKWRFGRLYNWLERVNRVVSEKEEE